MVQYAVIEGPEPDADILTIHIARKSSGSRWGRRVFQTISKTDPVGPKAFPEHERSPKTNGPREVPREGRCSGPSKVAPRRPIRPANRVCRLRDTAGS